MARRQHAATVSEQTEVLPFVAACVVTVAYFRYTVCVIQDPATKRRHPRGYIEFLEQHNTSLENHVAFLEQTLQEYQPDLELDTLQGNNASRSTPGGSVRHEDDAPMPTLVFLFESSGLRRANSPVSSVPPTTPAFRASKGLGMSHPRQMAQ
jgi:hypothetical protein